ncbi:hypothetical protein [Cryptosporangium sp. NPDC048952]|uniref:hypothetical protein n=1 Tax=Cryptosporangium sp. NPDC048952 TaxID=3363961 RepID=UPI003719EB20
MSAPTLTLVSEPTAERPAQQSRWHQAVYWIGLLLAAGADIGGFYGVVALALGSISLPFGDAIVFLIVIGLTAVVLILAHALGTLLKAAWLGRPAAGRWPVVTLLVVWLAIGVITFVIRLYDPLAASDTIVLDGAAAPAASPWNLEHLPMGLLFFGLYLGSGVATAWVAYLHHGLPRRAPGAVRRGLARRASAKRVADAARFREVARRISESEGRLLQAAAETRDRYVDAQVQRGEQLKQYARLLIAQHGEDPALTQALFQPKEQS